jgi:hypothetical protein
MVIVMDGYVYKWFVQYIVKKSSNTLNLFLLSTPLSSLKSDHYACAFSIPALAKYLVQ